MVIVYTPVLSRSLERKKVQAFCLLQIFFSGTHSEIFSRFRNQDCKNSIEIMWNT